jgi:hypothetical protein
MSLSPSHTPMTGIVLLCSSSAVSISQSVLPFAQVGNQCLFVLTAAAYVLSHASRGFDGSAVYFATLLGTSILGLVFQGYFYSFHFFHVIVRSDVR